MKGKTESYGESTFYAFQVVLLGVLNGSKKEREENEEELVGRRFAIKNGRMIQRRCPPPINCLLRFLLNSFLHVGDLPRRAPRLFISRAPLPQVAMEPKYVVFFSSRSLIFWFLLHFVHGCFVVSLTFWFLIFFLSFFHWSFYSFYFRNN